MLRSTSSALSVLPALCLGALASAQSSVEPYQTLAGPNYFAYEVAFVGDVDGDALDDFAVGSHSGLGAQATIEVHSGADGSLVYTFPGSSVGDNVGDVNADGRADVLVGDSSAPAVTFEGVVTLYSGLDGSTLFQWQGASPGDRLGWSVSGAGDVDADGVPDVIAGTPFETSCGTSCGMASVFSGADGSTLHTWYGRSQWEGLGAALAAFGDQDGDGFADVLVASWGEPFGLTTLFSGRTGKRLLQVFSKEMSGSYADDLATVGDVNADGTPDFAVTSPHGITRVSVYSGLDGSILYKHFTATSASGVAPGGDVDADGFADYALADGDAVRVYSGFDRSVLTELVVPSQELTVAVAGGGDLNGDAKSDFVVGSFPIFSVIDYAHTFLGGCEQVASYCVAGTSASGCAATLGASGLASASKAKGFVVAASNVEGQRDGLFFFGTGGRQAAPWGNGTSFQCIVPPVSRTPVLAGTGTAGACDGAPSRDLNMHWAAQPAQRPPAGALTQVQFWYRDPQSSSNQTTSLSDAIEVTVCP